MSVKKSFFPIFRVALKNVLVFLADKYCIDEFARFRSSDVVQYTGDGVSFDILILTLYGNYIILHYSCSEQK